MTAFGDMRKELDSKTYRENVKPMNKHIVKHTLVKHIVKTLDGLQPNIVKHIVTLQSQVYKHVVNQA
jgi:hypothetical protein